MLQYFIRDLIRETDVEGQAGLVALNADGSSISELGSDGGAGSVIPRDPNNRLEAAIIESETPGQYGLVICNANGSTI